VAHGAEYVYTGHVEELAVCWDEDPDADRFAGFGGCHSKSETKGDYSGIWISVDDVLDFYTTAQGT
jgi:hypothetical protein